jgi:hypothetical protein
MTLLTDYYDPNDPPRPTRQDEIDRLFGKGLGRLIMWWVFVAAIGGDPWNAALSVLGLAWWKVAIAIAMAIWVLAPILYAAEHLAIVARDGIRSFRE